jgi:hypothetical protein
VSTLIPAGIDQDALLNRLTDARIIRPRLDSSETKTWQLYHDYLADAIVALDRRNRKWALFLGEAFERYRLAIGFAQRWTRLLSPRVQLKVYWRRLRDPNFRFGEYLGFVRLSAVRLVLNVWLLCAVGAFAGWLLWNEHGQASQISDAFLQGGDPQKEFQALWRLAALQSPRVSRAVAQRLLSVSTGADRLAANIGPFTAALGLGRRSLDAMRGLALVDECPKDFPEVCARISLLAGDGPRLADKLFKQMSETTDPEALGYLGQALASLGEERGSYQAADLAHRILGQMQQTTNGNALANLGFALAVVPKDPAGDQAAQGANRILTQLQQTTASEEAGPLANAFVALAKESHAEQAARLADRVLAQMQQRTRPTEYYLIDALAVLTPALQSDQAVPGADQLLAEMQQTTDRYASLVLGSALAILAKETHGDQAARGADFVLAEMQRATDDDALINLGGALAALAQEVHGDRAAHIADRVLAQMQQTTNATALSYLGAALAALAKDTRGDQVTHGAGLVLAHMQTTNADALNIDTLENLGSALAALGKEMHADQAARFADRILAQMHQTKYAVAVRALATALAAVANEAHRDEAARGADLVLAHMQKTTELELSKLAVPLAALESTVAEQSGRLNVLTVVTKVPTSVDCSVAASSAKPTDLPFLIDMLKWPVCGDSRPGLILLIANLTHANPTQFGTFVDPQDSSTFQPDIRKFITWLDTQRDAHGKRFDIDGPPAHNPLYRN